MTKQRVKKSELLTKEEHRAFKKYVDGFPTQTDCAEDLGIERGPIIRIALVGSGAPKSIEIIRKKLQELNLIPIPA